MGMLVVGESGEEVKVFVEGDLDLIKKKIVVIIEFNLLKGIGFI